MQTNSNISVFGGTGFIGSRFCEMYPNETILIDREDYAPKSNNILYFISTVDNYNIHRDLHVDIDTNLTVLVNMLENIDRNNKEVVINFISSWFVYGKNKTLPFNEDLSDCNPTGFYSITKRCAEQILISFCKTFDIKYRIFRLANVLGEGDNKVSRKKNALQYMIKCIAQNEEIFLYDGGNVVRDYIYVDDACEAIHTLVRNAEYDQIINIGNGIPYVLKDIITQAVETAQSSSKVNIIKPSYFHEIVQVKDSYLDVTKLKSYKFEGKYDMDEIVKRLILHYK